MIRTLWIEAYNQPKGVWEEYEEPTGEVKTSLFGAKPVMVKKTRRVLIPNEYAENLIDGERLTRDLEAALVKLDAEGFAILSITPVISGRYSWQGYDARTEGFGKTVSPDTAVSWGYSVTEGFIVVARKG